MVLLLGPPILDHSTEFAEHKSGSGHFLTGNGYLIPLTTVFSKVNLTKSDLPNKLETEREVVALDLIGFLDLLFHKVRQ